MNWQRTSILPRVGIFGGNFNFVAEDFLEWNGIQKRFTKSDIKLLDSLGFYNPIGVVITANSNTNAYNRYIFGRENISTIENEQYVCYDWVNCINMFYTLDISENVFDRNLCSHHFIKHKIIDIVIISNIVFIIFYLTFRHSLF